MDQGRKRLPHIPESRFVVHDDVAALVSRQGFEIVSVVVALGILLQMSNIPFRGGEDDGFVVADQNNPFHAGRVYCADHTVPLFQVEFKVPMADSRRYPSFPAWPWQL